MSDSLFSQKMPKASVIIATYKDVQALNCILHALSRQSEPDFEVIVAEDGEDANVAKYLLESAPKGLQINHLTQADIGFRKTRSVNRAVAIAKGAYLIFLDGDTIPHRDLVRWHLWLAEPKWVCAGRRLHLGPQWSQRVRTNPRVVETLETWPGLLLQAVSLHWDHVRNFEIGAPTKALHKLLSSHHLNIVGCNFSCFREDMIAINGYDEDLTGVGGEDDDLQWRFQGLGIGTKNVKFLAISYHLYHDSRRQNSELNMQISARNRAAQKFVCGRGVSQHFAELPEVSS
jgi:glycosyltransferase involved in cell wall biosynthesis